MTGPTVFALTGLAPRRGAERAEIDEVERALDVDLPDDYRGFLLESDGLEGFVGPDAYLILWSTKEIADLNTAYTTSEFAPGLVLLGTDGGDTGYGFVESGDRKHYVRVPLVGMSSDTAESMGDTLGGLVGHLRERS